MKNFENLEALLEDLDQGEDASADALAVSAEFEARMEGKDWSSDRAVKKAFALAKKDALAKAVSEKEDDEDDEDEDEDEDEGGGEDEDEGEGGKGRKVGKSASEDAEGADDLDPEALRRDLEGIDGAEEFLDAEGVLDRVAKSFAANVLGMQAICERLDAQDARLERIETENRALRKSLSAKSPEDLIVGAAARREAARIRELTSRVEGLEAERSAFPHSEHRPGLRKGARLPEAGEGVSDGEATQLLQKGLNLKKITRDEFVGALRQLRATHNGDAVLQRLMPEEYEATIRAKGL